MAKFWRLHTTKTSECQSKPLFSLWKSNQLSPVKAFSLFEKNKEFTVETRVLVNTQVTNSAKGHGCKSSKFSTICSKPIKSWRIELHAKRRRACCHRNSSQIPSSCPTGYTSEKSNHAIVESHSLHVLGTLWQGGPLAVSQNKLSELEFNQRGSSSNLASANAEKGMTLTQITQTKLNKCFNVPR